MPDPGIPLPRVAVPTVLLWMAALAVWTVATVGALRVVGGELSSWWLLATVPAHAAVTFSMFTVLHESVHHAAGRLPWVNAVLGRLSMPFVAAWGSFGMFRYLHIEHHRNTNEDIHTDPDAWTEEGPTWQLPLRWLVMDLWYFRFYAPRLPRRPRGEAVGFVVNLAVVLALIAALVVTGHGWELLAIYVVPQRLGVGVLAWWFDWLPHHDLGTTARTDRFRATRMRVGWERVMTPLMFSQNYHLVHHIHPAIPFYRYVQAWKSTEADYLAREAPLATAWGRTLTTEEYRAWREVTEAYDDAAPPATAGSRSRFHALMVADVHRLTPEAVALTLDVPDALRESFRFEPGQHVVVRTTVDGEPVRRSYSICTTPDSGTLRIAVKQVVGGRFSGHANTAVQPGDVLEVMAPSGSFVLTPAPPRGRVLAAVAAGSGITPVLSIVASALAAEPETRATLLYVNRDAESTMFREELDALVATSGGRLRVVHLQSRGARPDRLTAARLAELLGEQPSLGDADEWYLCGPQALTDDVTRTLTARGVPADHVHRELFVTTAPADAPAVEAVDATVLVTLDGRTTEVATRGDESVLEAVLRSGVDAPYSCTGGACGTCKTRLLLGTVEMQQNHVLSQAEVADGWVLGCQARPTSSRLQIDYDAG